MQRDPAATNTRPAPGTPATSGTSFRQRLGYYALGIAIGVAALGFFRAQRHRAAATQTPPAATSPANVAAQAPAGPPATTSPASTQPAAGEPTEPSPADTAETTAPTP